MADKYPRIATLKSAALLRAHLERSGIDLRFDDELTRPPGSPLAGPLELDGVNVGNRFCILLAPFRQQRREVDLGRRGGGRPA